MNRIVFTVTTDLTYDQRMNRICQVLSDHNFHVTIVGRKKGNSLPLNKQSYNQKRLNCFFERGMFFYIEFNIRLFFYLLFTGADVISAADIDTALPAFLVSKFRRKKFVFDSHEYFTEVIELQNKPFVKKIWKSIESLVVKRTKYCYTVSEGLRRLFYEQYGKEFVVIRNVPVLRDKESLVKQEKYFIYAGAVNAGRGLEELISVWNNVPYKLIICGDGDVLGDLKNEVLRKGLNEKIIFTGYQRPEELRRYIQGAFAGILLLQNESLSYYYSLANKFFDYVHAEIPQITINFPEYVTLNKEWEVSILVDLEESKVLEAINRLIHDQPYYEKLKGNCTLARKQWNWQNESGKLINLYKEITQKV